MNVHLLRRSKEKSSYFERDSNFPSPLSFLPRSNCRNAQIFPTEFTSYVRSTSIYLPVPTKYRSLQRNLSDQLHCSHYSAYSRVPLHVPPLLLIPTRISNRFPVVCRPGPVVSRIFSPATFLISGNCTDSRR